MPLDRGAIEKQLQELGDAARWWNQRELRDLPAILHADERILAMARGKVARVRWLRRSWLIVITEARVLCVRSGRGSWRQLEVRADQITRVSMRVGPFNGRVIFAAQGSTYRLLVARRDAYRLVAVLSDFSTAHQDGSTARGPSRMIRRVVDHVLALPTAALDPTTPPRPLPAPSADRALEQRVDRLEEEVNQLRQQVDFLEQLLRQRP
ncbi:MAG TPA: PH domain-containing protein [Longimicrobiales bacterium]